MKYLIITIVLLCSWESSAQIKKIKERKGKYGFVMKQGGKVDYKYDKAKYTFSNLYQVMLDGKWGAVDEDAKIILECKYDSVVLTMNYCKVLLEEKWGILSAEGEVMIPIEYEAIQYYEKGTATVKTEKGWGKFENGEIDYNTDNFIFFHPEKLPFFEGCPELKGDYEERKKCTDQLLMKYIYENISYPESARLNGVEGTVVISFVVTKEGKLRDFKILRDPGQGCGAEVIRIMQPMTEKVMWIAGMSEGKPINCKMQMPVRFKLTGRKNKNK